MHEFTVNVAFGADEMLKIAWFGELTLSIPISEIFALQFI